MPALLCPPSPACSAHSLSLPLALSRARVCPLSGLAVLEPRTCVQGTQVTIVDRRELPDGTKRVSVARDNETRTLGWVSSIGKDGDDNLLRSEDPAAAEAIGAANESFAVRHPLNVQGTASTKSPSARASSRVYLPLASPMTKGKFHFFSFQINATHLH